ncbi:uracil-DNA glycosylase family protein [Aeromicrobium sp. JJY06]|uniref:uracil-DNA glycosylase family protein n=1 Tax=Aeromicrobium sp. JJY06 TaxID=3373478 RepID=UPI00376F2E13
MHQEPAASHIDVCHPWLEGGLEVVRPRVVVRLGATAGRSVLGRTVRIREERGHVLEVDAPLRGGAHHAPSALLRLRDRGDDATGLQDLAVDLRRAADAA